MRDRLLHWCKTLAKLFVGGVLLVSIGLWIWSSGVIFRSGPAASLGLQTPAVVLGLSGDEAGVRMLISDKARGFAFGVSTDRIGPIRFQHGFVLNALGFTLAVVPRDFVDVDHFISRHLGVVLPYWFLIAFSTYLLLWLCGWLGPLLARLRFSKASIIVMAMILMLFVALNFMPAVRHGRATQGLLGWFNLVAFPEMHGDVLLAYGFPFECLRTAFAGGRRVDAFMGYDLGWRQEKVMENLIVAALAALAVGLVIERLTSNKALPVPPLPNPGRQ